MVRFPLFSTPYRIDNLSLPQLLCFAYALYRIESLKPLKNTWATIINR
jgi:hypothetical protein